MNKHVGFIVGVVVLAAAIAGAVIVPGAQSQTARVSLPVSRVLACPVGDPDNLGSGKTVVQVADQADFTAGPANGTPSAPATTASFTDPGAPIVIRGSSSVGGIATSTEAGKTIVAPCSPPVTTGVWDGVLTQGQASTLILSNVDATPAMVDVFLYNETGPITLPGLSDITVAPGATVREAIDQLVSSDTPISVSIRTSRGRVSAVLRTVGSQGDDWQLPQVFADTDVVISGIPAGSGTRTLSVTNTDPTANATVSLEVLSESGAFAPLGLATIQVLPARTMSVDITAALGGQASALHLTSDRPITGTITVMDQDITGIAGQPGLNGSVVLPPIGGTVWIANPGNTTATVTLQSADKTGATQTKDTTVSANTIASVDLPSTAVWAQLSSGSASVRVSVVKTGSSAFILPVSGGGSVASVEVPRFDPGLG